MGHFKENCSVCIHGDMDKAEEEGKVYCDVDSGVYDENYKCGQFKHILDN